MSDLDDLAIIAAQNDIHNNVHGRRGAKIGTRKNIFSTLGKKQPWAALKRIKKAPITLANQSEEKSK